MSTLHAPFSALYAAPTATAKAKLGEFVDDAMGGRWRYCYAGAEILNPLEGAGGFRTYTAVTPAITAVGSWTMAYTGSGDATAAKDLYANGTIIIGASVYNRRIYHIGGNDATSDTTGTLQLYHPVRYAMAGTEWATINPNPWADVRPMTGDGYRSVVCMPMQPVPSGYYFWGKTRGFCFGIVASTTPGAAPNDRALAFNSGGALIMVDETWGKGTPDSKQYAGWLVEKTAAGDGDQSFMLQLE